MKIRKANLKDLSRIMEIYEKARVFMAENGNASQWGNSNWPPEELIKKDIENKLFYVCIDDEDTEIYGAFYLNYGTDIEPSYKNIEGSWIGNSDYAVVHRLAVDKKGMGVGAFIMKWVISQYPHIRVDTHEKNIPMRRLFEKLGFKRCGIIRVTHDNSERIAFELT